MTTAGDLIKGGVSGAAARLAIGTTGQVLEVVGGAPAWAAPYLGASLGYLSYVAASAYSITTTTAGTAVDSTNLTLANIVAPASGAVEVMVNAFYQLPAPNSANLTVSLVTHSTTTQVTAVQRPAQDQSVIANGIQGNNPLVFIVSGLTSGTSYQWDLASWLTSAQASFTIGAGSFPIIMIARPL